MRHVLKNSFFLVFILHLNQQVDHISGHLLDQDVDHPQYLRLGSGQSGGVNVLLGLRVGLGCVITMDLWVLEKGAKTLFYVDSGTRKDTNLSVMVTAPSGQHLEQKTKQSSIIC